HAGSTKSFDWVREHNEAVNRLDMMVGRAPITAQYAPGEMVQVQQHDGTVLNLRKLAANYDPTDRVKAMHFLQERQAAGEVVTGLLYVDPEAEDLHDALGTVKTPLNALDTADLTPGAAALDRINAGLR
ncbi:MAG: 2-oxoacid:ferredoxin oxidoreductase subunit beta, partial [Caulobacter sp.]|nr:2-oxoacid:ferredoxin oxidoreductase subunit beta [Caulobacter sp.]